MLHHGPVGVSLKQNKRNIMKPKPSTNPNPSTTFYCFSKNLSLYHNFYGFFTVYLLYEEVMSVRLYVNIKSHSLKEYGFPVSIKYRPEIANIKSRPEVSGRVNLLKIR